jgi:hypothetical protein
MAYANQFQKMALVDANNIMPPQPIVTPTQLSGYNVSNLSKQMKSILERDDIDDRSKADLYFQTAQRYRSATNSHLDKVNAPLPVEIKNLPQPNLPAEVQPAPPAATPAAQITTPTDAEIISVFPKSQLKKAVFILSAIKSDPNLSWDDKLQLKLGDTLIPGSNIIDIISNIVYIKPSRITPIGWEYVKPALMQLNLPQKVLGRPDVFASISLDLPPSPVWDQLEFTPLELGRQEKRPHPFSLPASRTSTILAAKKVQPRKSTRRRILPTAWDV